MNNPIPPINEPVVANPRLFMTEVFQRYLKSLEAKIKELEARIAALEAP